MRSFLVTIVAIACVIFLATGHFYWKEKTQISSYAAEEDHIDKIETDQNESTPDEKVKEDVSKFAANWPEEARNELQIAVDGGEKFKLAIVGSKATGGDDGWAAMLSDELVSTYGKATLEVQIFEYDMTSKEFIEGEHGSEVVDYAPNLVLFEPFILKDNGGLVSEEQNHENIGTFMEDVQSTNENAVFILQPSYPIYNAQIYPQQVDSLKRYAEEKGITYLNHWKVWPDPTTEEIHDYLTNKQEAPNKQGHEIWYEFLREYFIAE